MRSAGTRTRSVLTVMLTVAAVLVVAATSPPPDELASEELNDVRLGPAEPQRDGQIAVKDKALEEKWEQRITEVRVETGTPAPPVVVELIGQDGEVREAAVLGGAVASATVALEERCPEVDCRAPLFYRFRALEPLDEVVTLQARVSMGRSEGVSAEPLGFTLAEGPAPEPEDGVGQVVPFTSIDEPIDGRLVAWYVTVAGARCGRPVGRVLVVDGTESSGPEQVWIVGDEPLRDVLGAGGDDDVQQEFRGRGSAAGGLALPVQPAGCAGDGPLGFWVVVVYDTNREPAPAVWLDGVVDPAAVTVRPASVAVGDLVLTVTRPGQREEVPFGSLASGAPLVSSLELIDVLEMTVPAGEEDRWTLHVGETARIDAPQLTLGAGPCEGGSCPPVDVEFTGERDAPELRVRLAYYRFEAAAP